MSSVTAINGLGGYEKMAEHAHDTATLLNEIDRILRIVDIDGL